MRARPKSEEILFEGAAQGGGDLDAGVENIEFRDAFFAIDAAIKTAGVGQFHDEVELIVELVEGINVNDV